MLRYHSRRNQLKVEYCLYIHDKYEMHCFDIFKLGSIFHIHVIHFEIKSACKTDTHTAAERTYPTFVSMNQLGTLLPLVQMPVFGRLYSSTL